MGLVKESEMKGTVCILAGLAVGLFAAFAINAIVKIMAVIYMAVIAGGM
jgi:hypothetical protein